MVLDAPTYDGAQLRKLRNIDRARLSPAIHAAVRVADAVVRNLRCGGRVDIPPPAAQEWRNILMSKMDQFNYRPFCAICGEGESQ